MNRAATSDTAEARRKSVAVPTGFSHIVIEHIAPILDCGSYPIKRIVGEVCTFDADVFRDGHQILRANLLIRRAADSNFDVITMEPLGNDRWRANFVPRDNTRYLFTIEAWTDRFASWLSDFAKKAPSGRDLTSDLLEGIALLRSISAGHRSPEADLILTLVAALERLRAASPADKLGRASIPLLDAPELAAAVLALDPRPDLTRHNPPHPLVVDRREAAFSAWYEMFPRSQTSDPARPATLRDATSRLPDIRDLGFDVVYLPPVHPIGLTHRKGRDNTLVAAPDDPGSPWAIGNAAGGHDALDPGLGSLDDFANFVAAARNLGLEVALDLALQCSPDHPWVTAHPEWFNHRPDGSIKYAENPPKEYQDIYPLDFDSPAAPALMAEVLRIVRLWIARGVTIFRVDNPHTKPVRFWEWLISEIQRERPDILFLAEAFTRPRLMEALAKAGFTQSYTYFTWRNTKAELTEYLTELTRTEMRDYFRPNFFTNTPDILPPILQSGGPPAFKSRLTLAATLSPAYGIYSGFELCENEALPGTEEYAHSEKYEIRARDWRRPGNIREYVALLNRIRRDNSALQSLANLEFLTTDNEQIIFYLKSAPTRANLLLIAVNLDPHNPHHCTADVPLERLGLAAGQRFQVTDLLTGAVYNWSARNYVRLDPAVEPAHILRFDGPL